MIDPEKKYWLFISPHVYCNIKEKQALLYNTQTGEKMIIKSPEIIVLLESLHYKKNLGSIYFEGEMLKSESYHKFISEFCQKGMGGLVDVAQTPKKPVQLMPVLNLQRDIEKLQKVDKQILGSNLLHYLLELNVYINHAGQKELDASILKNILHQIQYGVVGKLNLLGDNVLDYLYVNSELSMLLTDFKGQVHIWSQSEKFSYSEIIIPDFWYDIIVTFPVEESSLNHCAELLKDFSAKYHFYVTSVEEFEEIEILMNKYPLENYSIHPVFTGKNIEFFQENIFLEEADIFSSVLSMREIFRNQKLNANFFGSLVILPDGSVKANMNAETLGSIQTDAILDLIYKEMLENTAWRKIRNTKPCNECLYQYICPSPSNYELVIGKPNLCHIKP